MSVDLQKIIEDGGYYDIHNNWNGIVTKNDKLYRERVEVLILNNKAEIFARVYANEGTCRFPGGSVNKKLPDDIQACNECKEEANIVIKNVQYSGIDYFEEFNILYEDSNKEIKLQGKHNNIYVGQYSKPYNEFIKQVDRDTDILYHSKFYPYSEIKDYMNKYQRMAYENFISKNKIVKHTMFYPYYTPFQMKELGIYEAEEIDNFFGVKASVDNREWFDRYCKTLDPGIDWRDKLLEYYIEYQKNPNDLHIQQTILEFGWNPEINPFNTKLLNAISESTKGLLNMIKS